MSIKIVAQNKKARHDYHILETWEAGLVLLGTEVKSLRDGKANLKDEADQLDSQIKGVARVFNIITKDRNCPSWYVWREFSSPKEQWEESVMLAMEKRREDFEKRIEQDRQDFELKLEETNRQERKRTNGIMVGLTIAAIIFAAMQVYAALASINPEHWLFNWLR